MADKPATTTAAAKAAPSRKAGDPKAGDPKKTAQKAGTQKEGTQKEGTQKEGTQKRTAPKGGVSSVKATASRQATAVEPGVAPAAAPAPARKPLRGVSAIRAFFRRNTTPIYFISPTSFNLLGVDRWISNFHYVNYYDSFGGKHPRVFVPEARGDDDFASMEEMNNYLLAHPEFYDLVRDKGPGKAVLVMFDEETERLARELGIDVALPSAALRHRMDSKLVTTRLGNEAGVPSVPNVLGTVADYDGLVALARSAGLGDDLVVQLPWGDSGKTTFFVDSRDAWDSAVAEHELTGSS